MSKRVTIKDVARRAGVSISTASLALNNRPNVSEDTRQKVLQAKEELGFELNPLAQAFVRQTRRQDESGRLGQLAFVLLDGKLTDSIHATMLQGVTQRAQTFDMHTHWVATESGADPRELVSRCLGHGPVDGVILAGRVTDEYIEAFEQSEIPVVVCGNYQGSASVDRVEFDCATGAQQAVESLLKLGHRRIGLVGHDLDTGYEQAITEGYRRALLDAGIDVQDDWYQKAGPGGSDCFAATQELLRVRPAISAVLVIDHKLCADVLQVVSAFSGELPANFRAVNCVVSIGEVSSAWVDYVLMEGEEQGERAVELLLDRLERPEAKPAKLLLPPTFQPSEMVMPRLAE